MLKPKQLKCLELMLEGTKTDKEIAEEINISQKTLCDWKKNNPEFQEEYNRRMHSQMQFSASKAFSKQMKLLKSPNDMVAHLAAKDIMDRAGFKPTDKLETDVDMELKVTIDYGE